MLDVFGKMKGEIPGGFEEKVVKMGKCRDVSRGRAYFFRNLD